MKTLFLTGILFLSYFSFGETKLTTNQYIDYWKVTAVEQMLKHKIPASITLAQGILESANGNSRLARQAKNHFGIKCHATWTGKTFIQDDDKKDECFRSYKSASDSYNDHSIFLTGRKRYANLFTLRLTDYKGWARGLKSAGYATNPKYANLLISIIEKYDLNQYDKIKSTKNIKGLSSKQKNAPIAKVDQKSNKRNKVRTASEEKKNSNSSSEMILIKADKHKVFENKNRVKYIVVKDGDTFVRLASEFELTVSQLYKYNEFDKKDVLEKGDHIYIVPKRSKAYKGNEKYVCSSSITLREVAHTEGVKLKSLMKLNLIEDPNYILKKGTKVTLR